MGNDVGSSAAKTGQLQKGLALSKSSLNSPICLLTITGGMASIKYMGCCEDSSDASIVLSKLAEAAIVKAIGEIPAIKPIKPQVPLQQGD